MKRPRIALSIRAQLLLVLTVFLAIPWLGYEYVRELERFLRDAQERTLAGTAQAVATALHDRPRLFESRPAPLESLRSGRASDEGGAAQDLPPVTLPESPEIEQIIRGLSRTTARIWVVDREQNVLARAGSLRRAESPGGDSATSGGSPIARVGQWLEREVLQPLYSRVLQQPTEDFSDEPSGRAIAAGKDVEGALARLAQYATYQEAMASRLSHELRTPIAVVRSSLDALRMQQLPDDARVYMERAQQGLNRLAHILRRMTEATRLEQSLADAERERLDLGRVIAGCVDGYRAAYPQAAFELNLPGGEVLFEGAPDLGR